MKVDKIIKCLRTCVGLKGCHGCPLEGHTLETRRLMMGEAADELERLTKLEEDKSAQADNGIGSLCKLIL